MKTEENTKELETQEMQGRNGTLGQAQEGNGTLGQMQGGNRLSGPPRKAGRRCRTQASELAKRRNSKGFILAAAAILFALTSMAAAYFYFQEKSKSKEPTGLVYEANIIQGDISGKTKEERQRELDAIVEEGMLAMSINATPSGKTTGADRTVNWLIENPSNQGKLIRVEIWRDDTGEKIYETGAIPPGNYVEAAPLKAEMPPGEYRCTARFYAYSQEDESYIGQAAAQIRLVLYE